MRRCLRFLSVVPWLVISACCTSGERPSAPAASMSGEVPQEVVAKLRAKLAEQAGADAAASARVVAAEKVDWPNGALGCPQPGRMYTQAIVPGYRVQFEAAGRTYSYHASSQGEFVLCQQPASSGQSPASRQ